MNMHIVKVPLLALALLYGSRASSQIVLLQEDFEGTFPPAGWTITTPSNELADGWTYGPQPGLLSSICAPHGSRAMVSQWASFYPNNTWAFTPGLALTAGTTYGLSFMQCVQSPSGNKTESLKVTVGTQAAIASQTQVLLDLPALTNTGPIARSTTFTPATSGVYHFAFNCYSAANQRYLSIDSVNIHTISSAPVFPAPYCGNAFPGGAEPITRVEFAGIANTSSAALNAPAHEDFTAQVGSVMRGGSYPITVKGNTNGAAQAYVKVYVDWDQDLSFTGAGEAYNVGVLYNSSGTDAVSISAMLAVPQNAALGSTRMRVVKLNGGYAGSPCNTGGQGQSEDYTLHVAGVTSVEVATQNNVPAYITSNGGSLQMAATVHPSTVDQSVLWSIVPGFGNGTISPAGMVTAQGNGNLWAKAASVADPSKKDSLMITIINQFVAPQGITIGTQGNVPAMINAASPTLVLTAIITPPEASQSVLWQVIPVSGSATINSAGMATPLLNGTAWAIARAAANTALRDSLLLTIDIPGLGIAEEGLSGIRLFPNPVTRMLFLQFEGAQGPVKFTLMDVSGKQVMQQLFSAGRAEVSTAVDLSALRSGVYILQLDDAGSRRMMRVVKE